ncbi:DNA sulfur modification protein DndB [Nocardia gipuzkoensis]
MVHDRPHATAVSANPEPVNRVLTRIVDNSPFFRGRIDETSKSLSKGSNSLFLLNQVRGLVKELLVGDYALGEDSLSRQAERRLGSRAQQDAFVADRVCCTDR